MRIFVSASTALVLGTFLLGACSSDGGASASSSSKDAGASGSGSTTTPEAGTTVGSTSNVTTTSESMTVGGQSRLYLLSVPKNLDRAKTYPLVMELHGSPGDAKGQLSYEPFDKVSGTDAIVVYPQALNEDSGAFSWDLGNLAASNPDVAFLEALPAELKAKGYPIDTAKVFGYGYSGGGFFLQVYQCLGAKAFKAISANAGGAPESLKKDNGGPISGSTANGCTKCPGTPVPELIVFGQNDSSNGGDFQALCQAEASQCNTGALTDTTPSPCKKYESCAANEPVEYCLIPGVGHESWAQATATSWDFFKTYL